MFEGQQEVRMCGGRSATCRYWDRWKGRQGPAEEALPRTCWKWRASDRGIKPLLCSRHGVQRALGTHLTSFLQYAGEIELGHVSTLQIRKPMLWKIG